MPIALQDTAAREAVALQSLAEDLVAAALSTGAGEALLARAQISLLAWLSAGERAADGGYARLSDLIFITIGMSARTLRERLRAGRLFRRIPAIEAAFLEGRLTLCQVTAAAPIFEAIDPADRQAAVDWIEVVERSSVRELRQQMRDREATGELKAESEEEGQRVSFCAPVGFRIFWDDTIDLARKMQGRDLAVHCCVAAILAEGGRAGKGAVPPQAKRERTIRVRPRAAARVDLDAVAHALETLRQTFAAVEEVTRLFESPEPQTTHDAIDALRRIERLWAPLQVLHAHIIRDLRLIGATDLLGYRSVAEMVEDRLHLSERSARNRVAESFLFESDAEIEAAFARGEISLMQAHLVRRLAAGIAARPFIDRARAVTWRQFQREARILDLLRSCGLGDWCRKPLPDSHLEAALFEALGEDISAIESQLQARGLSPLPPDGSLDPAENCIRMERLEALVEMLAITQWAEMADPINCPDRQTFAATPREAVISFWAPESTAADFIHAIDDIRRAASPIPRTWAAVGRILAEARAIWLRQDPKRKPAGYKIFERDNYRCIVPGCSSRGHLEDHHNQFRSQGGSDEPDNRSTLCHGHHRQGVHRGRIRITGPARHRLRIEIGCRPDGPPLLVLQGEKFVYPPPQ